MEPLRYATLEWREDDGGKPYPVVVGIGPIVKEPLQTEPRVVVPEEYRDVELMYVDNEHGRSAILRGRVLLPAVVVSPDVKRGPDGLPLLRPARNHAPPDLKPWQVLELPRYDIKEGEVLTLWDVKDVDLEEFRAMARAKIARLSEERAPKATNEDMLMMMDDPSLRDTFNKARASWNALSDAYQSAAAKAATHEGVQAAVDKAEREMVPL